MAATDIEKVFVFRLIRIPAAMWQNIEADDDLRVCYRGIYVPLPQLEAVLSHMRVHGVAMMNGRSDEESNLYLKDFRAWHILVTASYLDAFMFAKNSVPSRMGCSIRESGSFEIQWFPQDV